MCRNHSHAVASPVVVRGGMSQLLMWYRLEQDFTIEYPSGEKLILPCGAIIALPLSQRATCAALAPAPMVELSTALFWPVASASIGTAEPSPNSSTACESSSSTTSATDTPTCPRTKDDADTQELPSL